jgi:hypothetical protein
MIITELGYTQIPDLKDTKVRYSLKKYDLPTAFICADAENSYLLIPTLP